MNFVRLIGLNGYKTDKEEIFFVNPSQIHFIWRHHDAKKGSFTELSIGNGYLKVVESPEEILQLINPLDQYTGPR
jgi:hypothetical protein